MRNFFVALAMVAMLGIGIGIGCRFTHAANATAPDAHYQVAAGQGDTFFVVIDTTTGHGKYYQTFKLNSPKGTNNF